MSSGTGETELTDTAYDIFSTVPCLGKNYPLRIIKN